ncbi:nucleotidyltransferase domain-containing protein [Sphingomonas sp. HF-S4]|uniref:Nucleotidyltransferase domain-containing protein n=1 Tax=Sphingomonas agrestis TaxID=3080540 RepID=A0ABU3YCR9_9SPHN|nr:nucleotidyltransferase domain-containing protein [Sphingomonas sp. HF-S4]MDV3459190.1 nucleotidyltransferase domain-containing protein [Sphingomonas sp. HF-S4]
MRREIETRLDRIEADNGVRLLLAIESGSRAWGFPSPDSDYDVRFLYVRPQDWYLSLALGRDVIETPIEDEIDLNGWDVRKALVLLLKSNAVVSEWIESPIRYQPDDPFVCAIGQAGCGSVARWWGCGAGEEVFLRAASCAGDPCDPAEPGIAPAVNLQALVAASDLPSALVEQINALVEAKARTNERANGARLPEIDALIRSELDRAGELPARKLRDRFVDRADQLFLELTNT